jgi:hypothetical protein
VYGIQIRSLGTIKRRFSKKIFQKFIVGMKIEIILQRDTRVQSTHHFVPTEKTIFIKNSAPTATCVKNARCACYGACYQ